VAGDLNPLCSCINSVLMTFEDWLFSDRRKFPSFGPLEWDGFIFGTDYLIGV
jgi:hypothetical protein